MNRSVPSLRRNFLWSFAGNAAYAASLWGVLVILTKLGTAADVGRFALASAIANPLLVFSQLQLRQVFITDTDDEHSFGDYYAVRLASLPLALVALLLVAVLGYRGAQVVPIMIFGLARAIESISDLLHGQAQKCERLDIVAASLIGKGVASLLLFAGIFATTGSLAWALVALPVGWALPLLFYDLPRCRRLMGRPDDLRPRWRARNVRRIVWTALPLGLVMLLIQLRHTLPRTLLEHDHGEAELGIFAALSYLILVGTTIVAALSQASIARLARARAADDLRAFGATVWKLVAVGMAMGAAGVLVAVYAGQPVLRILYNEQYARHQDLFVLIMAAGGVLYVGSLLGAPLMALRAFNIQLWIHAAAAVVLIVAGKLLIPALGAMGAGWTTLAGAAWVTVANAAVVYAGMRRLRAMPPAPGRTS